MWFSQAEVFSCKPILAEEGLFLVRRSHNYSSIKVITYDNMRYIKIATTIFSCLAISATVIFVIVTTKKNFLAFRVSPALKDEIQQIAANEARSISQICELLLSEAVDAYKKEGGKFMQRLIAKQKTRSK
jgi:hypothetical protein